MAVHCRWPLTTGVAQGRYYCTLYAVMLNALLYTFILYHILFLIICDAFMCVHCIVFYSSATEALINNNEKEGVRKIVPTTEQ